MRKYFLVAAATLMLVGCTKEQSEFTSSDLNNDALPKGTVVGTVKYDAGAYKDANGIVFEENFIPAAGKQVKIEVSNDSYISGSTGNQTFLAEINNEGKYSFTLPLGLAATNVKVSVVPFYAEKSVLLDGNIVSIPNALYNVGGDAITKSFTNKDVKTYDFKVTSDDVLKENLSKTVTVSGKILLQQWVKDGSEFVIKNKASEKKWDVTCEVTTWDNNHDVYMKYTKTGIKTNVDGEYSFSVNLPDNWKDGIYMPQLKISTKAELDNAFTGKYYVIDDSEWKSQTCKVLYPSVNKSSSLTKNNEIVPLKLTDLVVSPELQDKEGVKGIGNPSVDKDGSKTLYNKGQLNSTWAY